MANPPIPEEKQACRSRYREILDDLGAAQRASWSERIVEHLVHWLGSETVPDKIATYAAFGTEVDLSTLPERLKLCCFVYPRIISSRLEFRAVRVSAEMKRGPFGIREPDPARHPAVEIRDIDVCLCPGLAFAADGSRLGRGKGHYDRALAHLGADAPRVGVGFGAQLAATLPHEAHDVCMTHLVSEEGFRRIGT